MEYTTTTNANLYAQSRDTFFPFVLIFDRNRFTNEEPIKHVFRRNKSDWPLIGHIREV